MTKQDAHSTFNDIAKVEVKEVYCTAIKPQGSIVIFA
jgi:hypothetical protein